MPQYVYKCLTCQNSFDSIEKINTEKINCIICEGVSNRVHGQDLPAPPLITAGVGGVDSPRFGERKYQ